METNIAVQTDLAVPPGEYLEEILDELGITKDELARRMGRPAPKLSPIFKGRKAITPDTALQLEKVIGVPAHVWTGLEADYRLVLARQQQIKERDRLKEETPFIKPFCYAVLAGMGAVPKLTKGPEKVLALQKFFGVTSLHTVTTLRRYEAVFRCGAGKTKRSPEAIAAWLRLGELKAREIDCAPFDKHRLKAVLTKIRTMTLQPPDIFLPQLNDLLSTAGIALVILPHFPKTYAHGATFPSGREKAVLMLSIRGKWADIFWFILFHELGHILLHDRNKIIVEYENGNPELEKLEREADQFASDILISGDKWSKFIARKSFLTKDIQMFSRDVGVDTGIVVGRLQHEAFLKPSWGNDLRARYEWPLN
jgi:HTH-type transcriptional regulator / antitoxin HigA